MQDYQERYINNLKKIADLSVFYKGFDKDFASWMKEREESLRKIDELREENNRLLSEGLFPALDSIHEASPEDIKELERFAAVLMDWTTNLDPGIYVVIHDALLRLYRQRKDRKNMIKELYMLGMGLYYVRRNTEGVDSDIRDKLAFRNEMVFSEAASYLRYYDDLEDSETRSYVVRALHNLSLCTRDLKRRIAFNARAMKVMTDEHYRQLAPDLPWDRYVQASHQQMSINRNRLAENKLTQEEIALVLDSCYEVFKPASESDEKNVRWIWPYYDMEYNCGYVDLDTTIGRLEQLIDSAPYDQYDIPGFYANVQLVAMYSIFMDNNPQLQTDENRIRFLERATRKMLKALVTCPADKFTDNFFFMVDVCLSNYHETAVSIPYRDIAETIMRRFSGTLYIKARKTGDLLELLCSELYERDKSFFDDIPFISHISDEVLKKETILRYAQECGFFSDFGSIKMNIQRTMDSRKLFEDEEEFYQLHARSGYGDLSRNKSTHDYADIALGHHKWYDGTDGYPDDYIRIESPYRQMTDAAKLASDLLSRWDGDMEGLAKDMLSRARREYSPMVVSCLLDKELCREIENILGGDDSVYYKEIYDEMKK